MALQKVIWQTKKYLGTFACEDVALCLNDSWAGTTVSGVDIIFGTIQNNGRPLGPRGQRVPPPWENPRGVEMYQYEIVYDDAQITGAEPLVTCADIGDVQDACFWQKFVDYVESQA